jgi:hypothetical protein
MSNTTATELPISVKEQLLELSKRLPEAARSPFIQNTSRRIKTLASEYENTLVYAAVGWVIGEIMDTVLTVPFIGSLTGDNASQIGMMISGLLGFAKDRKEAKRLKEEQERVLTIIREELQSSLQIETK